MACLTAAGPCGAVIPAWLCAAQLVLDVPLERAGAGPGEAADECFVDVGEPGVREAVAQVVQVGPDRFGAHGLPGRRGVGQGLVAGGDLQPWRAARATSAAARARTCCSVAGGKCSGSASGWLTSPAYRSPSGQDYDPSG